MNDRDASRHAGELPVDPAQADRLDRYLDGLVGGDHRPEPGLDIALAATARAAQGPAGADPDGSAVDRTWRDLMARRPRPQLRTIPASSGPAAISRAGLGDRAAWTDDAPRPGVPASRASRVRAFGNRTLGVVTTLALVAVIVLSGAAVWLNAPRAADPPPTFLAGVGATPPAPAEAAVWATPGVHPIAGAIPADAIRPIVQPCTVTPRTIDDVITTLALPYAEQEIDPANSPLGIDPFLDRPFLVPDTIAADGRHTGVRIADLPSGTPVDATTIEAIALLYGQRMGCTWGAAGNQLALEALRSDDALIRLYWDYDAVPNGGLLVGMARTPETVGEVQARVARDGGDPSYLPQVGQPAGRWLWGFRSLPDGRVAAYIAIGSSTSADQYPATFDPIVGGQLVVGYIVFVNQDGRWLIDEESGPLMG